MDTKVGWDTPTVAEAAGSEATVSASSSAAVVADDDLAALQQVDPKHYRVGGEIARGGMGRVLEARDRRLGRQVAIKELLARGGDDMRLRFEREVRITARLQHPGIVGILEAGQWPSGEPFYVMRLVAGESMDKVIRRHATLAARLALLPHVIAAVDALAYAHGQRIIHRDLKPGNVLIGEFGETVVIDWGLAKDLAADTPDDDMPVGPTRETTSSTSTVAGAVLGTPSYMPVEQANGELVDARADVYALGAMLYHVLAGGPPYTGTTANAVLADVLAGPPVPIARRVPDVPTDLIAIVDKAMARKADDRYPTAKELADDLKKFQTGQLVGAHRYTTGQLVRRWMRRHRAVLAVVGVALAVVAVAASVSVRQVVSERDRTAEQRVIADRSRAQAEELLDFMLVSLRDKLRPIGRLDLLDDVARKADGYFGAVEGELSPDDLGRRSEAMANLAEVLRERGQLTEALVEARAFAAANEYLLATAPGTLQWETNLVRAHREIGRVLGAQGRYTVALAEDRAALTYARLLVDADPNGPARRHDLAVAYIAIGVQLINTGETSLAIASYRDAAAALAGEPASPRLQEDLADLHAHIAGARVAVGDTPGALVEARAARDIYDVLVAAEPANAGYRERLATTTGRVAAQLAKQGAWSAAKASYDTARGMMEVLVARDPSNATWALSLAIIHTDVAIFARTRGEFGVALDELHAAKPIAEGVVSRDPTGGGARQTMLQIETEIGLVQLAMGDNDAAIATLAANADAWVAFAAADPANESSAADATTAIRQVGDAYARKHATTQAVERYRVALARCVRQAGADPASVQPRIDIENVHHSIAVALAGTDPVGAIAEQREALAGARALADAHPGDARMANMVGLEHGGLGDLLRDSGDTAGALIAYRAATDAAVTVASLPIDVSDVGLAKHLAYERRRTVANARSRTGDLAADMGDIRTALADGRAALAAFTDLAHESPDEPDVLYDLATEHADLGRVLGLQGDHAGAVAEQQLAIDLYTRQLVHDPNPGEIATLIGETRRRVCRDLAALGRFDDAIATCQTAQMYFTQVAIQRADDLHARLDLGEIDAELAATLLDAHRADEALARFRDAEQLLSKVATADLDDAAHQLSLAAATTGVGDAALASGDRATARAAYERARAVLEPITQKSAEAKKRVAELEAKLAR